MMIAPGLLEGVLGGSFYNSPFVLYDQTVRYTGSIATISELRFSTPGVLDKTGNTTHDSEAIGTSPLQWHEDQGGALTPIASDCAVRLAEEITGTFDWTFSPAVNTWHRINTHIKFAIAKPGSVGLKYAIGRFQLALWADTTDILAEAIITVEYDRTV